MIQFNPLFIFLKCNLVIFYQIDITTLEFMIGWKRSNYIIFLKFKEIDLKIK